MFSYISFISVLLNIDHVFITCLARRQTSSIFVFQFAGYNVVGISLPVCIHSSAFPSLVFCCWCEILARQEKCYFAGYYCGKIFLLFYRRVHDCGEIWALYCESKENLHLKFGND